MRVDDPVAIVDHFEKSAGTYARAYEGQTIASYAFNIRRSIVAEFLPKHCGQTLDIGCGPGVMVDLLETRVEKYLGVDPADSMIQECVRQYSKHPKLSFQVGRIERINEADNRFDTSICMGVLEYLADDRTALKELIRVTKPSGTIIITLPNRKSPYRIWRRLIYVPLRHYIKRALFKKAIPESELILHREYSFHSVESILTKYACKVEGCAYYNFQMIPSPLDKWLGNVDLRLARFLQRLSACPLGWLGTGMVLKLTKL